MQETVQTLAANLGELLLSRAWSVTTAESCTGGGIAQAITDIPGSSQWFELGFVTYSNEAKQKHLGVSDAHLLDYGAVSQPVVDAMAMGALRQAQANIAVAVSGIAGPDGGSDDKPVGTVWISWALASEQQSRLFHFPGQRSEVRSQSIVEALKGAIALLKKNTV